jgi:DMSO/TMAO reductase YedYZ heme-binding membrane subunit
MLRRLVEYINESDKLATLLCYVSTGLSVLSCIYLTVLRYLIADMERLGFTPCPKSDTFLIFIALVILLALGAIVLVRRYKYSNTVLQIVACSILFFHATAYAVMTLYLLFYRAPDMTMISS